MIEESFAVEDEAVVSSQNELAEWVWISSAKSKERRKLFMKILIFRSSRSNRCKINRFTFRRDRYKSSSLSARHGEQRITRQDHSCECYFW